MRLQELKAFRSSHKTLEEVIEDILEKGTVDIASGMVSIVIVPKNRDYVYRIWNRDAGYEHFLEYVKKNPNNPHLPKLLSRVRKVKIDFAGGKVKQVNVLKLEKLSELPAATIKKLEAILDELQFGDEPLYAIPGVEWLGDELEQTIDELLMMEKPKDVDRDLHAGNIMCRGKTLVIIDPFIGDVPDRITVDANFMENEEDE